MAGVAVQVAGISAHARQFHTLSIQPTTAENRLLDKASATLVVEQVRRPQIIGDVDIQAPVAIQVRHEHCQSRRGASSGDAGAGADVGKSSRAVVAVQAVRDASERSRCTDNPQTRRFVPTLRVVIKVHFDVIADIQIQQAIAVNVPPSATGGEVRTIVQSGLGGDIDEMPASFAVRFIVIEDHAAHVRHYQIVPAIVVIVANSAAQVKAGSD
jgi:hypothetical protein